MVIIISSSENCEAKTNEKINKEQQYQKRYYLIHKEKMSEQMKEWHKKNKTYAQQKAKKWYLDNRTAILEKTKERYKAKRQEILEYTKEWYKKNRVERLQYDKKYADTHKAEKLQYDRKYRTTINGRIVRRRANNKRKRKLGYNPLNEPFKNSTAHHINNTDVIFIPTEIHKNFYSRSTQKHRELVLQFYVSIDNMLINKIPEQKLERKDDAQMSTVPAQGIPEQKRL